MPQRWSKLKKKIEDLFVSELNLQIHANVYKVTMKHDTFLSPRTWLQCDGKILFDFPGMFLFWKNPEERGSIRYMTDRTPDLGWLIDEYLMTPKAQLLDKEFTTDPWGLTHILKISDRRLGKEALKKKFGYYPLGHPAGALLNKRVTGQPILSISLKKCRTHDLIETQTGLPDIIRVKTKAICDGYSNPEDIPAVRLFQKYGDGDEHFYFSLEIADEPKVLEEQALWWDYEYYPKEKLILYSSFIRLNKDHLLEFWRGGLSWTPEQIEKWAMGIQRQ